MFVLDACASAREAIRSLLQAMNVGCEAFASAKEFLGAEVFHRSGCLVTEVRLPDVNGLQIQQRLDEQGSMLPVVFLTADGSVSIAVHAMRAGAVHFLEKPIRELEVWEAIQEALQIDRCHRAESQERRQYEEGLARLSDRERELLEMIARGEASREIADRLGVCTRTVEFRRRGMMEKLGTGSQAALIRYAVLATRGGRWGRSGARAGAPGEIPLKPR